MSGLRALTLFVVLTALTAGAETIRITNGEWQPYMSQYSYEYGINSHVISEAYRLEGIKVEWGFFSWKRAYESSEFCTPWQASATWWPTQQIKERFLISEPISSTSFVFFHLKNREIEWERFEDLEGQKIGITAAYHYGDEFMRYIKTNSMDIEQVLSDEENIRKLFKGEIDLFPNDLDVGYAQIRNLLPDDHVALIDYHPREFARTTLHLIISKRCENAQYLVDKFNTGFARLKSSGRFEQMQKDLSKGRYDKKRTIWK